MHDLRVESWDDARLADFFFFLFEKNFETSLRFEKLMKSNSVDD